MAKTIPSSINHLFEAANVIMAASKTPETLLHNLCDVINHMQDAKVEREDIEVDILKDTTTDCIYSVLLFIQSFVKPWFRLTGDNPSEKMTEGLDDVLNHAGIEGWKEMTDVMQVSIAYFMADPRGASWNLEMMRLHQGFSLATVHLEMHVAGDGKMLKAA